MDVTKPYKFIGFGAMYVTKPYKFIGSSILNVHLVVVAAAVGLLQRSKPHPTLARSSSGSGLLGGLRFRNDIGRTPPGWSPTWLGFITSRKQTSFLVGTPNTSSTFASTCPPWLAPAPLPT